MFNLLPKKRKGRTKTWWLQLKCFKTCALIFFFCTFHSFCSNRCFCFPGEQLLSLALLMLLLFLWKCVCYYIFLDNAITQAVPYCLFYFYSLFLFSLYMYNLSSNLRPLNLQIIRLTKGLCSTAASRDR